MTLTSGTKLGPYEVVAPAGAGGMGEVYRARDTRLNRDVAVKILPAAFACDPERMWRFQQEAQAIAALNHPNILAIHDFGEHEGSPYIVTEFLEGETLRIRLGAGALPVRKATEYAEQIGRGLTAAHEKGIVHRDLKPENIFVTRDGRVKVLDFGLAKLSRTEEVHFDDVTLPSQTQAGVVMGTAGYMSPEQVRAQVADHRSDLFSFGAILYEMLSGKRAFEGDTAVEAMSAILTHDPPECVEVNRNVPPALDRIVRHCLEKNPEERFQSSRDVTFALGSLSDTGRSASGPRFPAVPAPTGRTWGSWLRIAGEVALLGAVLGLLPLRRAEKPELSVQASILPPPGDGFWVHINQPGTISPDGRFLALVAMHDGHSQLWLRHVDKGDAQPIAGSDDLTYPFWSPDSRYIGFFAGEKLKKVDVSGGAVTDICPAGNLSFGASWSPRGVIVFSTFADVLKQVPENGGTPERINGVPLASDAMGHHWPVFLPDGIHFVYLEWRYATPETHQNTVWVGSLDGDKARRLPLDSTNVQYVSGYLLFSRDGDLFAEKFDPQRLEFRGLAIPIARHIQYDRFVQAGAFSVSDNGVLVYAPAGTGANSELTWLDRSGKALATLGEPGQYFLPSISPDGKRVAVGIEPPNAREKIWIYDVDRGTRVPLDPDESGPSVYGPVWSPDGKHLLYRNLLGKRTALFTRAADGSGEERQVGQPSDAVIGASDWSKDGRYLSLDLTRFMGPDNWHNSVIVVRPEDPSKQLVVIDNASSGKFSPDGHWLAYYDETSGQLYVTAVPGPGARIAVSSAGGSDPRWRGDGQELFYVADDLTLVSARVRESAGEFHVLSSQRLFRMELPMNQRNYDVSRDGNRFLVTTRTAKEQTAPLTIITNWMAGLQNANK